MLILAGDIGGTKALLGLYRLDATGPRLLRSERFAVRNFTGLEDMTRQFLGTDRPDLASFGVPGPCNGEPVTMANLNWVLDRRKLSQALGGAQVHFLNDLEATARGIATLLPGQIATLNAGNPVADGTRCVIAAGTGLGSALLVWDGERHVPRASEAGHADFAPRDDDEMDLARYLRARCGKRTSVEHVVSGQGLPSIYRFLRDVRGMKEPAWLADEMAAVDDPNPVISRLAMAGKCALCERTLDMFVAAYGAAAGNLALAAGATGGLYIAGGIAPAIIDKLRDGTFMRSFASKGRLSRMTAAIPVQVVVDKSTALRGAMAYAKVLALSTPRARPE